MESTLNNVEFVRQQYNKQQKVLPDILNMREGIVLTIVGENGAGKTNYAALTCPFKHTLYLNFETNGSAKTILALNAANLIECNNQGDIMESLNRVINQRDCPYKVIVIDSFKEMINSLMQKRFQGASGNPKDFYAMVANEFITKIQPRLEKYFKEITKMGISIVVLCGINDFDNKEENPLDGLQCYVKSAKEFIRSYSNHIFILRNKKREAKFSLAKDNGGFLNYSYEDFFINRNLIYNSENKTIPALEYKEDQLIPYGIANILYVISKKQQKLIEGLQTIGSTGSAS